MLSRSRAFIGMGLYILLFFVILGAFAPFAHAQYWCFTPTNSWEEWYIQMYCTPYSQSSYYSQSYYQSSYYGQSSYYQSSYYSPASSFSSGGTTSGNISVSPSQTTTYTGSCTGAGGTAQCNVGAGTTLAIMCTPATTYSCSGNNIVETSTSSACAVTTNPSYASCTAPQFCSPGSATCLYNAITGSISASPRLVGSGKPTQITWSTTDTASCTVSGTNGDTWTGTSASETSSPITQVTTYTIQCDDADPDTTEDDYTSSVTVVRVPSWLEL